MSAYIIAAIVSGVLVLALVAYAVVKTQKQKVTTGAESMVGRTAIAQTALNPTGSVRAEGEIWRATAEGARIKAGEEVIIAGVDGLKLRVRKKQKEER
ncbi:MAG: NfeD family protein [Chloroflexota bacterium]